MEIAKPRRSAKRDHGIDPLRMPTNNFPGGKTSMPTYRLEIGGVFATVAHRDINLPPFEVERLRGQPVLV